MWPATSSDFPTVSPLQPSYGGSSDAFVAQLNTSGDKLTFATYLGGPGVDFGSDITVNSAGLAFVTGTASPGFPTRNALQPYGGGTRDVFVARLKGAELISATYFGGSGHDRGLGITVDAGGAVYVTGATTSPNLPAQNSGQPTYGGAFDAFVLKLDAGALVYTTYLGGSSFDSGSDIAADANGSAYVVGETVSTNYPTKNAWQRVYSGGPRDAFITKLDPTGSNLLYSTYLGGRSRADTDQAKRHPFLVLLELGG